MLRWRDLWMPATTIVLLSLAFAPVKQFYFAWVGLVPWLLFIRKIRTRRAAFLINFLVGWLLCAINMAWLTPVTWGGMLALTLYMALYWGFAALVWRGLGWREGETFAGWKLAAGALAWAGLEFLRANLMSGIPWLQLGHTQSPLLVMCQIADFAGAYGISVWIVALNAAIAMWIVYRRAIPLAAVAGISICIAAYGVFRMRQTTTSPGPRVMVVQSNFPQSNTGEKGAPIEALIDFHVNTTRDALAREQQIGRHVDLVAWSETMMPPMNPEALEIGPFFRETFDHIAELAREFQTDFIVGGYYYGDFKGTTARDQRNSSFLISRDGRLDQYHYDKIHLVPFGEFVPFQKTMPWLYKLLTSLAPQGYEYTMRPGSDEAIKPFRMSAGNGAKFVSPICFEDVDASLLATMFRGDGGKRADFIVNLTNDGWFARSELAQHLQIGIFRSIENRAATARAVNTGISGFIDSCGRVLETKPPRVEGVLIRQLELDSRTTFYTRHGDLFAWLCLVVLIAASGWGIFHWYTT